MYANIYCNPSAFKHNVTVNDINCAMAVPLVDRLMEKHINKYLVIGFDLNGNLIEIMYNLVDEDANGVGIANVFHAMRCRKEMYQYLPRSI
jgi:hypothetical protein